MSESGYTTFAAAFNAGDSLAPLLASDSAALKAALQTFVLLDKRHGGPVTWHSDSGLDDAQAIDDSLAQARERGDVGGYDALIVFLAGALERARDAMPGTRLSVGEPAPRRMTLDQYAMAMAANFDKPIAQEILTLDMLDAADYARQFLAKEGGLARAATLLKTLVELREDCDKLKPQTPDKARLIAQMRADFVRAEDRLRGAIASFYRNPPPVQEEPTQTIRPEFNITVEAPVVNLEAQMPAAQEVRITSMPARETLTDVRRNAKGQIIESTQIERDAPEAV
jgi:hypothetical protein